MPKRSEIFIANRLYYSYRKESHHSRPAIRVALMGIIIGMVVMILTLCVVVGFKQTITEKVAGFGSHIQVVCFDNNNTYEMQPIFAPDSLLDLLKEVPHITSVSTFATKPGVIKTDSAFQGIVFRGLPLTANQNWNFFASSLKEGRLPEKSNEVILSRALCKLLCLKLDESFLCYFFSEDVRVRKFKIVGVYDTSFMENDLLFVMGDISVVRLLNGWTAEQVSGIEMTVDNFRYLDETTDHVYYMTANHLDEEGSAYYTQNLIQTHPAIFSWLDLLDMNVWVILILMMCVSGFTIISGLIILILDSIQLIGTLKALGATNRFMQRIFIIQATRLVGRGVLIGDIIGLGIAAVQYYWRLIPLDASTYYVDYVPMAFPWILIVLLNMAVVLISVLLLLAPSAIVTRISPAKVMHFE